MKYSTFEGLTDADPIITTALSNIDKLNTPLYASKSVNYLTPTEIPEKPLTTTMDASAEDLNTVIIQQNILYTVATMTAVTFLITGIVLANDK
jgi:hypothetical protein